MTEENEHKQICDYIRLQYPDIIFNTDLSGIKLTIGQAKKVKKLRSNNSFPDLIIYESRKGKHGLFLELKKTGTVLFNRDGSLRKNEHLKAQYDMIEKLRAKGYESHFAVGFEGAKFIIDRYLKLQYKQIKDL